jgi:hypothetical protein
MGGTLRNPILSHPILGPGLARRRAHLRLEGSQSIRRRGTRARRARVLGEKSKQQNRSQRICRCGSLYELDDPGRFVSPALFTDRNFPLTHTESVGCAGRNLCGHLICRLSSSQEDPAPNKCGQNRPGRIFTECLLSLTPQELFRYDAG